MHADQVPTMRTHMYVRVKLPWHSQCWYAHEYNMEYWNETDGLIILSLAMPMPARATAPVATTPPTSRAPPKTPDPGDHLQGGQQTTHHHRAMYVGSNVEVGGRVYPAVQGGLATCWCCHSLWMGNKNTVYSTWERYVHWRYRNIITSMLPQPLECMNGKHITNEVQHTAQASGVG